MNQAQTTRQLIGHLNKRGVAGAWHEQTDPLSKVEHECTSLGSDQSRREAISKYLSGNPIIKESLESMLAQLAMAAGVKWQDTSAELQPLAYRGWHIGRWLPTFLLIDGPLGKLLRDPNSPIAQLLKQDARSRLDARSYPLLCSARDAFNSELFRVVRNGFAHWSFHWSGHGREAQITIIDWKTGVRQETISLLEAEALHWLTARVIYALDACLLRKIIVN
jgi:hypothetical protein